jgi:hypothetical protein
MLDAKEKELLDRLGEKLKGKPVADTLKRIASGKTSKVEMLKGLTSLLVHVWIEIETGDRGYESIAVELYKIIGTKMKDGI